MSSLRGRRAFRAIVGFGLALLAMMLLAACGGDDEGDGQAPTGEPIATAEDATSTPDGSPGPSEAGEAPIFWRTEDNFESLRAGEAYKVVFRVTSGYDEDTLLILAAREDGTHEEFEATRVEPVGPEEPGTFYHVLLELPEQGIWQVTVVADADEVTLPVEVGAADSPAG